MNGLKKTHPNHLNAGDEVFLFDQLNNSFSIGRVTKNETRDGDQNHYGKWRKIETEQQRIDGKQHVWIKESNDE